VFGLETICSEEEPRRHLSKPLPEGVERTIELSAARGKRESDEEKTSLSKTS